MLIQLLFFILSSHATTIAIIDTGFDLDHEFLRPRILRQETDEEVINPKLDEFKSWQFHNNSHLSEPIIQDQNLLDEILRYRNLRAKGHQQGLSLEEFEWYKGRHSDKSFQERVRQFKKHSHGTLVAGIALREGENIQLFPIRGLNLPTPVIAINDASTPEKINPQGRTPEEKFQEQIRLSQDRVVRKFSKICKYLSLNKIDVVNASYGITYKNISSKFREKYKDITSRDIDPEVLEKYVQDYFQGLFTKTEKIIRRYPRMLFIFSAGNSGLDNDLYPHYPSKIKLPNTISVGAMNGEFLASFSNYGFKHVDIGAPGVAILSILPRVYSKDGSDIYSPSSGTSMAAPYISNLAAQVLNINKNLRPEEVKRLILETGDVKDHLKSRLISGAVANNQKALKAALLSVDMKLDEAISLAHSGIIPMEDSIQIGRPTPADVNQLQKKILDAIPQPLTAQEIEEIESTNELSSPSLDVRKDTPDNSPPPPSTSPALPQAATDPAPSNQNATQSPLPVEDSPPFSSPVEPPPAPAQTPESAPSGP
jgi:cell wall-associated protease